MADDNRTEKPTAHRLSKAREQGQVSRSRDLTTALSLLAVVFLLAWQPRLWVVRWRDLLARLLETGTRTDMNGGSPVFVMIATTVAQWLWPTLLAAMSVALLSTVAQGGFLFASEPIKPNWGRLNPASNLKRLFSVAGWSRTLRSLLPATAILYLSYGTLRERLPEITRAARLTPRNLLAFTGSLIFALAWRAGFVFLLWSGADYFLQRWHHERSLRMTKQEIKEESKDLEGNPEIRGRIRRLRRQMRRKMMMHNVPRATAVITNPTHYAVAIEYRAETMPAPIVVAKGRNLLAQKIKRIARWHDIPIVENPPLAQALWKSVEVGDAIPPKLYAAVAEILAFLYRAQARLRKQQPAVAR